MKKFFSLMLAVACIFAATQSVTSIDYKQENGSNTLKVSYNDDGPGPMGVTVDGV